MANLNIAVTVEDNQTMSQYAMTKSGKVAFFNAGDGPLLVVTPKSGSPFCQPNGTAAGSLNIATTTIDQRR